MTVILIGDENLVLIFTRKLGLDRVTSTGAYRYESFRKAFPGLICFKPRNDKFNRRETAIGQRPRIIGPG